MAKLKDFKTLKDRWLKKPDVRKEYDALKTEFQFAEEIIKARAKAKMTHAELARRIGTKSTHIKIRVPKLWEGFDLHAEKGGDIRIQKTKAGLLRKFYLLGNPAIFHKDPGFSVTPSRRFWLFQIRIIS